MSGIIRVKKIKGFFQGGRKPERPNGASLAAKPHFDPYTGEYVYPDGRRSLTLDPEREARLQRIHAATTGEDTEGPIITAVGEAKLARLSR